MSKTLKKLLTKNIKKNLKKLFQRNKLFNNIKFSQKKDPVEIQNSKLIFSVFFIVKIKGADIV